MLITELQEAMPDVRIMLLEPFVLEGMHTCATEEAPERWQGFHDEVALRAAAARSVAKKHQLPFVELQSVFDSACQKAEPTYWLFDGVHPTTMGHELIAREWMRTFEQAYPLK